MSSYEKVVKATMSFSCELKQLSVLVSTYIRPMENAQAEVAIVSDDSADPASVPAHEDRSFMIEDLPTRRVEAVQHKVPRIAAALA
jgi:hypothetical protein